MSYNQCCVTAQLITSSILGLINCGMKHFQRARPPFHALYKCEVTEYHQDSIKLQSFWKHCTMY